MVFGPGGNFLWIMDLGKVRAHCAIKVQVHQEEIRLEALARQQVAEAFRDAKTKPSLTKRVGRRVRGPS